MRAPESTDGAYVRGDSSTAGRQAAALFLAAAVATSLQGAFGHLPHARGLALVSVFDVVAAGLARLLPWARWRQAQTLWLLAPAFASLAITTRFGGVPSYNYGIFFVLIFLWVGIHHRRWTALMIGPPAVLAYVAPYIGRNDPDAFRSVAVTIPVSVIAAEVLARFVFELRHAKEVEERSNEALAEAAVTDELTGVGNRRHGNTMLGSLHPGDALLLLDLDHFKGVNDTLGHAEGDRVLAEFGAYLRTSLRDHDAVARYGGEEFIVVLRGNSDASAAAQRLLDGWRLRGPATSFSVGVAVHRSHRSPALTFGEADAALYEAKRLGRNRYHVHRDPSTKPAAPAST